MWADNYRERNAKGDLQLCKQICDAGINMLIRAHSDDSNKLKTGQQE